MIGHDELGAGDELAPLCEQLTVTPIADSGHYPMQETPPLLVATIERFLKFRGARS